jgi:hypothetical protein
MTIIDVCANCGVNIIFEIQNSKSKRKHKLYGDVSMKKPCNNCKAMNTLSASDVEIKAD